MSAITLPNSSVPKNYDELLSPNNLKSEPTKFIKHFVSLVKEGREDACKATVETLFLWIKNEHQRKAVSNYHFLKAFSHYSKGKKVQSELCENVMSVFASFEEELMRNLSNPEKKEVDKRHIGKLTKAVEENSQLKLAYGLNAKFSFFSLLKVIPSDSSPSIYFNAYELYSESSVLRNLVRAVNQCPLHVGISKKYLIFLKAYLDSKDPKKDALKNVAIKDLKDLKKISAQYYMQNLGKDCEEILGQTHSKPADVDLTYGSDSDEELESGRVKNLQKPNTITLVRQGPAIRKLNFDKNSFLAWANLDEESWPDIEIIVIKEFTLAEYESKKSEMSLIHSKKNKLPKLKLCILNNATRQQHAWTYCLTKDKQMIVDVGHDLKCSDNIDLEIFSSVLENDSLVEILKLRDTSKLPPLSKISLRSCNLITDDGFLAISPYCHQLTELDIRYTRISPQTLMYIANHCKQLKHLLLTFPFKDVDKFLSLLVQKCPQLEKICLAEAVDLTKTGIESLLKNLKLSELKLYNSRSTVAGSLIDTIVKYGSGLEILGLIIPEEWSQNALRQLANLKKLKSLHLVKKTPFNQGVIEQLRQSLPQCKIRADHQKELEQKFNAREKRALEGATLDDSSKQPKRD